MADALTKEEFAAAVRAGRGRAYLHVRQFGLSGVADMVLAACLQDQSYDPQCEGSRAAWLFSMFDGAKESPTFSCAIVDALEHATNTWDSQQLCELAALMGKGGDARARDALRTRALRQAEAASNDLWVGAESLMSIDGIDAVPDLARRYGRVLGDDPKRWPPCIDDVTKDSVLIIQSETILQELAESDADIRSYLTYWQHEKIERANRASGLKRTPEEMKEVVRERSRRELPLEKILLDAAAEKGDMPGRYMRFGKCATAEELATVLRRLDEETVEGVCKRLLWVFRRAPLPTVPPKIWDLSASPTDEIRWAALEALAQVRDPRVGELGRSRLLSHQFADADSAIIDLFVRNYLPGDEQLIMEALQTLTPTADNAHGLCWSLLDIADHNNTASLLALLNWAYETTPCTNCRLRALKHIRDLGGLGSDIIQECLFDADEDIRQLATDWQCAERI